jgi:hypothetical protein
VISGRTVALTLALGLMLTVPSVWADHHQEPSDDSPSEVAWVWFDTFYEVVKSEATMGWWHSFTATMSDPDACLRTWAESPVRYRICGASEIMAVPSTSVTPRPTSR